MDKTQSPKISVNEKMLCWAVQCSGKSVDKLVKTQQMKNLEDWIGGKKDPTVKQLEVFSAATSVPFGYLLFSDPPNEQIPIPHFRTLSGGLVTSSSANLIDTMQIIEQRQDWMREYLIADGAEPLDFVGSAKPTDSYKATALMIRKELGIDQEWASAHSNWNSALSAMNDRIENAGIFLSANGVVGHNTQRALDPEEFRGFVLVDEYAPFIFVNHRDFKAVQMFTLAHELAHIWIGKGAVFDLRNLSPANDQTEIVCNRIAAEFLISEEELADAWNRGTIVSEVIESLSKCFKVSKIVVARRALDLEFITKEEFDNAYAEYSGEVVKSGSGGNFYATANLRIGKRFAKSIISAARNQSILYRDAYHLTGLNRGTFEKFAKQLDQERQS